MGKKQPQYTYYSISQEVNAIRIDQLVEYSMTKIFLERLWTVSSRKLVPDPFFKIDPISGSIVWSLIQYVFIAWSSRGLTKYVETKVLTTCFYFT